MEILPVTRKERFLKAAMDSEPLTIDAVTRIETYLSKISGADVTIPDPVTKIEMYLASIAGADVVLPDPITRVEKYLAKLAGMDVLVPEPITRIEQFLSDWVNQPVGVLKTISGAVVFVSDALARAAEDISVEINPIQDLHGYANPWPAGGGKNLFNINDATAYNNKVTLTFGADGSLTVKNENTYTIVPIASIVMHIPIGTYTISASSMPDRNIAFYGSDDGTTWTWMANGLTSSVQSATVTTTKEYVRLSWEVGANETATLPPIQLESGSTPTAWSPYSNICPITGWTEAKVWRTGKNLFDIGLLSDGSVTVTDGVAKGTATAFHQAFNNGINGLTVPGSPVTISATAYTDAEQGTNGYGIMFRFYYSDGTTATAFRFANTTTESTTLSGTSANGKTVEKIGISYANNGNNTWHIESVQLELGSTATAYEPYQGNLYPIDLDGTVYGGTLDVTTGVLTVERAYALLNDSTKWDSDGSTYSYDYKFTDRKKYDNSYDGLICSYMKVSSASPNDTARWTSATSNYFCLKNSNTTLVQVQQDASDGKIAICYELATPLVIQLTPTEIEMLEGDNTLWADAGDVTVTYMADGPADDVEALNILLGNRYVNLGEPDEATDREALDILLGGR